MPATIENEYGKITMTDDIIASIAGFAASENCGIVGMTPKTAGDAIWQLIGGDNQRRGVKVAVVDGGSEIDVDIYVTLMYGVSLPAVANNAIANVRYRINELTGLTVRNVTIHVEAIRV